MNQSKAKGKGKSTDFLVGNLLKSWFNITSTYYKDGDEYFVRLRDGREISINKKQIMVTSAVETRTVRYNGQQTRTAALKAAIENKDTAGVMNYAKSIADWQMEKVVVSIFKRDVMGIGIVYLRDMTVYRQQSFLVKRDKVCYVALTDDVNDEEIIKSFEDLEDASKEIDFLKFKEDKELMATVDAVGEYLRVADSKLIFLGGNPNAGLLLFSADATPANNEQSQKIAKVKLSGGIKFRMPVKCILADLDNLDGEAGLFSDAMWAKLLEVGVLPAYSKWLQFRAYKSGRYAMKGTLLPASSTKENEQYAEHAQLHLGEVDAVVDIKAYSKAYGMDVKVGDIVQVSEWLILRSDASLGVSELNLSYQMISRAPIQIKNKLVEITTNKIKAIVDESKTTPTSMLPKFGFYEKMRALTTPLSSFGSKDEDDQLKEFDYTKAVAQQCLYEIRRILKKGVTINGASLALVKASMRYDEVIISRKVAEKLNIKVGDRITIITYPMLPGNANGSPSLFSKKVIGFLDFNGIAISTQATKIAMRDYDGDVVFITTDFIAPEQVEIDYSLSKQEHDSKDDMLKFAYSERNAIRVFCRNASNVGYLDNLMESAMKFKELTDEEIHFLANCTQGAIYKMKHEIKKEYSVKAMKNWLQLNVPKMWKTELGNSGKPYSKAVKHPDLEIRKGEHMDSDKYKTYDAFVEKISLKGLTANMATIVKALLTIKPYTMPTQSNEDFEFKASKMYRKYASLYTASMKDTLSKVADGLYSIDDEDLDVRNMKITMLSNSVKAAIGEDAHYLLCIAMFNSNRFNSLYWPFMFSSNKVLNDIDNLNDRPINSIKETVITINDHDSVEAAPVVEVDNTNIMLVFRAIADGGNSLPISDYTVTIANGKAIIDGNEFKINLPKSGISPVEGQAYKITRVEAYKESAFYLSVTC